MPFFCVWIPSFLSTIVRETTSLCILNTLVKTQLTIYVWVYFWTLHSIGLYACFFVFPASYSFNYQRLIYISKSESVMLTALLFVSSFSCSISGLSWFHINFRMGFLFLQKKKCHWDFDRIAFNLEITLDSIDIFTLLSPSIHEHVVSFLVFVSYFNNHLWFLVYKPFISLIEFNLKYFIFLMLL